MKSKNAGILRILFFIVFLTGLLNTRALPYRNTSILARIIVIFAAIRIINFLGKTSRGKRISISKTDTNEPDLKNLTRQQIHYIEQFKSLYNSGLMEKKEYEERLHRISDENNAYGGFPDDQFDKYFKEI